MFSDIVVLKDFLKIQKKLQPTMSIEIGSYDGDFSKKMVAHKIPVYAFEASPYVYEKFKYRMKDIHYINKAVTNYEGSATFYIDGLFNPANIGHNSIKANRWNLEKQIDVPCTSLDSYFAHINNEKIALWIDCEGANKEVLEGASRILSMTDSILIEVEHMQLWKDIWIRQDVIDYLDINGFALYKEYPAYKDQTNCLFIKKNKTPAV